MSKKDNKVVRADVEERYDRMLLLIREQEREVEESMEAGTLLVESRANGLITSPAVKALDASLKTFRGLAETLIKLNMEEEKNAGSSDVNNPFDFKPTTQKEKTVS